MYWLAVSRSEDPGRRRRRSATSLSCKTLGHRERPPLAGGRITDSTRNSVLPIESWNEFKEKDDTLRVLQELMVRESKWSPRKYVSRNWAKCSYLMDGIGVFVNSEGVE